MNDTNKIPCDGVVSTYLRGVFITYVYKEHKRALYYYNVNCGILSVYKNLRIYRFKSWQTIFLITCKIKKSTQYLKNRYLLIYSKQQIFMYPNIKFYTNFVYFKPKST